MNTDQEEEARGKVSVIASQAVSEMNHCLFSDKPGDDCSRKRDHVKGRRRIQMEIGTPPLFLTSVGTNRTAISQTLVVSNGQWQG